MRKLLAVLSLVLILLAFVACSDDAGGSGNGNSSPSGMSAAEQKIFNKYGQDVFYFAELADIAASNAELVEEICGAEEAERAAIISMYSSFGIQITNASGTTVSFRLVEEGNTITVDITNVHIEPSKGLNDSISYDADISVSGKESHSAQVSLEIDLVNNTTTITQGRYKTIVFGTDSDALSNANNCLKEIMALDDGGEGSGSGPYNPGPYNPGPGQGDEWTMGTDSLPAHTAREIALALEGMDYYVLIEEPQGAAGVNEGGASYFYEYGLIHGDGSEAVQVWTKRWDELPAEYMQESQYDMIALDRIPAHQFEDPDEHVISDYIYYEDNAYSDAWYGPVTGVYHDEDGSRNWHDAVVYWVYEGEDIFSEEYAQSGGLYATYAGGEFYHYSDLVKPYTPALLNEYNGKYEKLARKAIVAGLQCSIYRYAGELYYIADSEDFYNICLKHTWLAQGKEYVMFEVQDIHTLPVWPVE